MTWTSIWHGIESFFDSCFRMMKGIGVGLNYMIWISIAFLFFYWVAQIVKQNKQAKKNGTYL